MTNKATLTYEIIEFGETHTIVFDINKESLMGYMTIYDNVGNIESRTEYFLSDDNEWTDIEHEIGQLELDIIFGDVKRIK